MQTRTHRNRALTALAVALAVIGLTSWSALAVFTDSESTTADVETGDLDIVATPTISISDLAPGDAAWREVPVTIPATAEGDLVAAIRMRVGTPTVDQVGTPTDAGTVDPTPPGTPAGQSLLSGANGLRITLRSCAGGTWTLPAVGAAATATATCTGTGAVTKTLIDEAKLSALDGSAPYSFDATALGITATSTGTIPDGSTLRLLARLSLPPAADNAYEGASLTTGLVFEAQQRAGIVR